MFAVGVCVGPSGKFGQVARPHIGASLGPDVPLWAREGQSSIFTAYNSLLDQAKVAPEIDALLLIHDDVEIRDSMLLSKLSDAIGRHPNAVVIGTVGARYVQGMSWWEGQPYGEVRDPANHHYYGPGVHPVDCVDGLMLCMTRWAIDNLRFDEETFDGFHGYDTDICFQAREAGKLVLVVPGLDVYHHSSGNVRNLPPEYEQAAEAFRRKWDGRRPAAAGPSVARDRIALAVWRGRRAAKTIPRRTVWKLSRVRRSRP